MFEMFITLAAAVIAALYGISQSVFMNGPHQRLYRYGFYIVVAVLLLSYIICRQIKRSRVRKLNVDLIEYMYYEKYTSPLYRIGYFVSYLIQNILFDYIYMRRNFNFCKGLDVYDDGVSEYYIKFRNTWYRYLFLTLRRHKVSVRKLQAFAAIRKNDMILQALATEEERERYRAFEEAAAAFREERGIYTEAMLNFLPHADEITHFFKRNLEIRCLAEIYIAKYEPTIIDMVNRQKKREGEDVNDFKKLKL